MEKNILSKSTFIRGAQCLKSLYLNKKRPFLRDRLSAEQRAKFSRGHQVGFLAQDLFPGGIDMSPKSPSQYQKAVLNTAEAIHNKTTDIIYEACFQYDRVLVMLDILVIKNGRFYAYEVKSSKSISETYILDAALQYYVISNAGFALEDFCLIYMDGNYTRKEELDIHKLFKMESVKEKIIGYQEGIENKIAEEKQTLLLESSPKIKIGEQCFKPYPCDFQGHCWKKISKPTVFDFSFLSKTAQFQFLEQQKISISDFSTDDFLDEKTKKLFSCLENNENFWDKKNIQKQIQAFPKNPVFVKVLVRNPAIPEFPGTKPYQAIPLGISFLAKTEKGETSGQALFDIHKNPFDSFSGFIHKNLAEKKQWIVFDQPGLKGLIDFASLHTALKTPFLNEIELFDFFSLFENNFIFYPQLGNNLSLNNAVLHLLKNSGVKNPGSDTEARLLFYNKKESKEKIQANILDYLSNTITYHEKVFSFVRDQGNNYT
jgi:hypothetical protein